MRFDKLKRLVDPARPITYGIVQAGPEFEGGIPYIRPADMTDETGVKDFGSIKHTSPEIAQQYRRSAVQTGDLVISIGPSFGKVMEVPSELSGANLTQGTARVAPGPSLNARFAFWCLRSHHCYSQWEAGIGGATFRALNLGPLAETRIPNPDLATQRQIADFLDRETARIDLLIEKKQRLVALLGEKHAVELASLALGLKSDEAFDKDSWDQLLPTDWAATSLKNLINPNRQITYGIVQPGERDENGILMVRGQDYSKGWAEPETVFRVSPQVERPYARARLRAGDIVMTIVGAGVGNVAIVPTVYDKANITQTTARLAINPRAANAEYVKGVLESKIGALNVERFKRGAAQPGLMLKGVARFRVPVPPMPDQKKIAARMQGSAERVLNIQTKTNASINRLKEYRSALITAAVTGQIDVAHYAESGTPDRRLDAIQEEMGA